MTWEEVGKVQCRIWPDCKLMFEDIIGCGEEFAIALRPQDERYAPVPKNSLRTTSFQMAMTWIDAWCKIYKNNE